MICEATSKELNKVPFDDITLNVKLTSYNGLKTNNTGLNDTQAINSMIEFLEKRKKYLIEQK